MMHSTAGMRCQVRAKRQYLYCKVRAGCRVAAAGFDTDLRVLGDDRTPSGRMTIRRPP